MEITNVVLNDNGRGEVQLIADGTPIGKMDIAVNSPVLTVYHTEVDPQYEGRGMAKLLLAELVSYAREKALKIVPLCPYVQVQFKRHPEEYKDVWYKEQS